MLVAAHTLGCKLNYAETSDLLRRLVQAGHTVVDYNQRADLYIINTCTVTAVAEKKCRNAIRQAVDANPDAMVVVVGCFVQNAAHDVASIPGVSLVLGNDRKHLLPQMLASGELQTMALHTDRGVAAVDKAAAMPFAPAFSSGDRTRTFFKIQDGCDYFCTYCAIPHARGRSRSATTEETLRTAWHIAEMGAKEVVLTGVNTGTFGQQHGETLLGLLRELDKVEGIVRYRISSIEPNLLSDDMIDFVASSRAFLPHFHIPLQAGSDRVLSLMHRRYDTALYRHKVEYIKKVMPDACIAADVMAGFNGETEEEFARVTEFLADIPISYLHVFTYSERPNTVALRMGERIPMEVRREHTRRLLALSEQKHRQFIESQLGKRRTVLWESTQHGDSMQGWTDNYIRVHKPFEAQWVNRVEEVALSEENIEGEATT